MAAVVVAATFLPDCVNGGPRGGIAA